MRNRNVSEVEGGGKGENDKKKNQAKTGISMSDMLTKSANFEFL